MSEFIKNTVNKNKVVIEKRTKKKLKKPSLYKVVMLNDDSALDKTSVKQFLN